MNPFSDIDNVSSLPEKNLIARVCEKFGESANLPSPFGAGDDCAVIESKTLKKNICLTSDAVILDVHFSREDSPFAAGEKLIKRNASDIAAMGARPFSALASSICSPRVSLQWLDEFSKGMGEAARRFGIKIVGGDFTSVKTDFFSTHLTLLGESDGAMLKRDGAAEGDFICVTGALGASFESGHHLSFEPRIEQGVFFANGGKVTSCTDISDGIASDLRNLLPRGMCAELCASDIPLREYCGKKSTLKAAFCDGEDYELLFTVSVEDYSKLASEYLSCFGEPIYRIGQIKKAQSKLEENALILLSDNSREVVDLNGFDHYS